MATRTQPSDDALRDDTPRSARFEILHEIACGGMAKVFLGCRRGPLGFERLVAIKRSTLREARAVEQILQEARLASKLHHPNVVPVIDVDVQGGEPLLIMEYVEGASLSQLMMAGPLPPSIVARLLCDACEGIAAVHAACDECGVGLGIVHRDVSPQNLLVGVDGVARVADFGIALERSSARTTAHSARRGKPAYMAPEYVQDGRPRGVSDVYALGVVLWEALTGRRLFDDAKSLEELRQQHEREVPPPSLYVPELSPAWDALVLRALERAAERRIGSARELAQAIERVADGAMASRLEIGQLIEAVAHATLSERRAVVRRRLRVSHPNLQFDTPAPWTAGRVAEDARPTVRVGSSTELAPACPPPRSQRAGGRPALAALVALLLALLVCVVVGQLARPG